MKLKKREIVVLQEMVSELTDRAIEDIDVCEIIAVIKMLGQLADDIICKK